MGTCLDEPGRRHTRRLSPCWRRPIPRRLSVGLFVVSARTHSVALYTGTSSVKLARMCQRFAPLIWFEPLCDSPTCAIPTASISTHFRVPWVSSPRLACGRAKQEAIEVDAVLCKAGLTHQQIDDPRARLPVKAQIRFLELAATALRDDCLGFHLAQKFDLRMAGLFHYVLASSDTLDEALQRAARYSAIVNEGITLSFREGRVYWNQF